MFKLLSEADKKASKSTNKTVFAALCESQQIQPVILHESMHLLLTKAIDLLARLDKNDYSASAEISKLPFYALATVMVAAEEHMGVLNQFRKEVGDRRSLADFMNDKSIVQAPSDPSGETAFSTVGIMSNFSQQYAKSAIGKIKNAFEAAKKDPETRAVLLQRLRQSQVEIDKIYSKAVGDKETTQKQQPQRPQRTA